MERKTRVPITEELVNKALPLFEVGLNASQVGKLLNISEGSAKNIRTAGSWEGLLAYRKASQELMAKRRAEARKREDEAKEAFDQATAYVAENKTEAETHFSAETNEDVVDQLKEVNLKLDQLISIMVNGGPKELFSKQDNKYRPF